MPNRYRPPAERFAALTEKTVSCWNWLGAKWDKGYGQFCLNGRRVLAHRFAWEQVHGPILPGLTIDHLCRNRGCVNPAHMETVPNRVNVLRGVGHTAENARKTHCPAGHPYEPPNLIFDAEGRRRCRHCMRLRWYRRRDAARRVEQGVSDG